MSISKIDLLEKVKIVPKPDDISWEEVTEVIHKAFAEKKERGMNYLGTYQDVPDNATVVGVPGKVIKINDQNA